MSPTPQSKLDLQPALGRLLADAPQAERVVRTMARGRLAGLPELLTPYGLYPLPPEICIPIIKVISGAHPVGYHSETRWWRYLTPPPRAVDALRVLLSDADVQRLRSTFLPTPPPGAPVSLWDLLVIFGLIVQEVVMVADFVVLNETRQTEICKVMHGNPVARRRRGR